MNPNYLQQTRFTSEMDEKWMSLNKITEKGEREVRLEQINQIIENKKSGYTKEFIQSLSSEDRKRNTDNPKNHKLSYDSSLIQKDSDSQKFSASPASKCKRRQITGSLFNQNKNFENQELSSFVDNDSLPQMNTKGSNYTGTNRDFLQTNSNIKKEISNLASSQEKHLLGSEREDSNLRANTYHQGFSLRHGSQSLDLIRAEIREFLETNNCSSTSKFVDKISKVYESYINIQEQELLKVHSEVHSNRKAESVRNEEIKAIP